jgi:hypothetical protein
MKGPFWETPLTVIFCSPPEEELSVLLEDIAAIASKSSKVSLSMGPLSEQERSRIGRAMRIGMRIGRNDGLQFIMNLRGWNWGIKKQEPLRSKGSGEMEGGQSVNGYIYALMTKSIFQGSFF